FHFHEVLADHLLVCPMGKDRTIHVINHYVQVPINKLPLPIVKLCKGRFLAMLFYKGDGLLYHCLCLGLSAGSTCKCYTRYANQKERHHCSPKKLFHLHPPLPKIVSPEYFLTVIALQTRNVPTRHKSSLICTHPHSL